MKKTLFFGIILTTLLIINSCSTVDSVLNTGIIECKVNGAAWKSTILSTFYKTSTNTLAAASTNSSTIGIQFSKAATVGTYSLAIDTNVFIATYVDANQKSFIATAGVVQITEVDADGKLSGTFYLTCKDALLTTTVSITEGKFTKVVKK
jgi:hypothetical protein